MLFRFATKPDSETLGVKHGKDNCNGRRYTIHLIIYACTNSGYFYRSGFAFFLDFSQYKSYDTHTERRPGWPVSPRPVN